MNRLFGTAKPQAPKPTLQDASASMDKRNESFDSKIGKLDKEVSPKITFLCSALTLNPCTFQNHV